MVFSSHIFLFYFLPVFLAIYYALPFKWKGFTSRTTLSPLPVTFLRLARALVRGPHAFVHDLGLCVRKDNHHARPGPMEKKSRPDHGDRRRHGLLVFFKYYMFTVENINHILAALGLGAHYFRIMQVLLPSGISFYTFVALSYTIDLYRGEAKPARTSKRFPASSGFSPI